MVSVCKAGRPIEMRHGGNDAAVLLIHGYAGYPGELTRPARDLYKAGYDVFAPRLPGHATNGEDFSRTHGKDWLGAAVKEAEELRKSYRTLCLLGHSMGGTLSILTASKVPVDKLVLAAPGVYAPGEKKPVNTGLLKVLSIFKKRMRTKWQSDPGYIMYYEDAPGDDEYLGSEYWSWLYLPQLVDLMGLMDEAQKAASSISCPTLIIGAGKDAVVGLSGPEYLSKAIKGSKYVVVPGATHYLFYDKDKDAEEEAVQAVLGFCGERNA